MDDVPLASILGAAAGALIALFFSAVFSGSEIAFYAAHRLYLIIKARQKGRMRRFLAGVMARPSRFVLLILIGNNFVLALFSILFSRVIQGLAAARGLQWSPALDFWMTTVLSTVIVLLFGEYLPKALFYRMPERMLLRLMPLLAVWYILIYPIFWLVMQVMQAMGRLVGIDIHEESTFSLRDWYLLVVPHGRKSSESSLMVRRALEFPDVRLRDCLVPRNEVVGIDVHADEKALRRLFREHGLSRIIVYDRDPTRILGYVHAVSLFSRPRSLREVIIRPPFFPESMKAAHALQKMIGDHKNLAVVVDEYGTPIGIVTVEDILEEVVGDIRDEFDRRRLRERKLDADTYELSARLEVDYLNEKYDMELPRGDYQTLGGLIVHEFGRIPARGEKVKIPPYEFEVMEGNERRIHLLKAHRIRPSEASDGTGGDE